MSTTTKAFVNLYAAIGSLTNYCQVDENAAKIASEQNISVRFKVKGGPDGVLIFNDGKVHVVPYDEQKTDIVLFCPNTDNFNAVVDGKGMPLPIKGLFKTLKFMGKPTSPFSVLSGDMAALMRAKEFKTPEEKKKSTIVAFYTMVAAIAQIGNVDSLGMISANRIPDGIIAVEIKDVCGAHIIAKDGHLTCVRSATKDFRARMQFANIDVAKGLIDNQLDSMACISSGDLVMEGYIPMLENLNKILNLVPKYLS